MPCRTIPRYHGPPRGAHRFDAYSVPVGAVVAPRATRLIGGQVIRLFSVEYPGGGGAVVTFELYSDNHGVAGTHQRVALLPHRVVLNGKGRYDYGQLVATAADRLRADLQGMVNVLTKEHIAP